MSDNNVDEPSDSESEADGDKNSTKSEDKKNADVTPSTTTKEPQTASKPKRQTIGKQSAAVATTPGGKKKSTHPRTLDMVIEAIEKLNEPKGASIFSIRKWILENYQTVRPDMIRMMLRSALTQGVEEGYLTRPRKQHTTQIMGGRYLVTKKGGKAAFIIERTKKKAARNAKVKQKLVN